MVTMCFSCFRQVKAGGKCPFCEYDGAESDGKYPLALQPGTILADRYVVGRVLGQGGFGITYIVLDQSTRSRVAVKEYFQAEIVGRSPYNNAVVLYSADRKEEYEFGRQQFLNEARTLSAFVGNEHIINILNFFDENSTSYYAMEYIEGSNLKQYLMEIGHPLLPDEANRILLPVMEALSWVHSKGIVHRDISPDNIMIRRDQTAKLIDFGSARFSTGEKSQSLDIVL